MLFFKDFAGPAATVVAAAAAAFVTISIQNQNRSIKRDELRLTLFDRRYAIYVEVRDYIIYLLQAKVDSAEEIARSQKSARLIVESSFVCSEFVQQKLYTVKASADFYLEARDKVDDDLHDEAKRKTALAERRKFREELRGHLATLPMLFRNDMTLMTKA